MEHNPIAPSVELRLNGATFNLAFDMTGFSRMEKALNRPMLFGAIEPEEFSTASVELQRALFYGSLAKHHGQITQEHSDGLMTVKNAKKIFKAAVEAFVNARREAMEEDEEQSDPKQDQ